VKKEGKLVVCKGSIVSFQRKGSDKIEKVCLCGRDDIGAHGMRPDCKAASLGAPLAQALLGKKKGSKAVVKVNGGLTYELTITEITLEQPAASAA
jgi:transcription elongation GreA/GreB family factor